MTRADELIELSNMVPIICGVEFEGEIHHLVIRNSQAIVCDVVIPLSVAIDHLIAVQESLRNAED